MNLIQKPSAQQTAKIHTVKVNNGSGVIVSSLDPKVSYILTARHVLDNKKARIVRHDGKSIKEKKTYTFQKRGATKDIDCAIIEIDANDELAYAPISATPISAGDRCWMIGYPESKAQESLGERCKIQDGEIAFGGNPTFVMNAANGPGKVFINGFSGSGVFIESQGECKLVGIETRVDDPAIEYTEHLGRLRCYTLSHYQELLKKNDRPSLAPYFMSCFSRICESIFDLQYAQPESEREIRNYLINSAKEIIEKGLPKPFELMEKYNSSILVSSTDPCHILDAKLWTSLLEFYLICGLIDFTPTIDSSYIENSMTTRAFLYSGLDGNWIRNLKEILTFAHNNLSAHGIVVVSSPQAGPRLTPNIDLLSSVILDIASPSAFSKNLEIDNGTVVRLKSLKVNHLTAIHSECLLEYESVYSGKEPIEFMKLFRLHYGKFITCSN